MVLGDIVGTKNKSDIVDRLSEVLGHPRRRVEVAVNDIFDAMATAMQKSERIEIRGFGSFVTKEYEARAGRNPRTGESISVEAKRRPAFKVGKELRERVNKK